jgi:hypothetical protein
MEHVVRLDGGLLVLQADVLRLVDLFEDIQGGWR